MKMTHYALPMALTLLLALPAGAEDETAPEPIAAEAEALQEQAVQEEEAPEPTPAVRSFDCAVDSEGERCTLPLSEGDTVDGVVAYKEEHTGKWVDFGWGPFNREGRPHGCDWVLTFRERLVEERGCFEDGKRHGPWETCRLRLDPQEPDARQLKCPVTDYEMGIIVVKAKEPEPELLEESGESPEKEDGVKPQTDKS